MRAMVTRAPFLLVPVVLALTGCAVAPVAPSYGYGYGYGGGPAWVEPAPYYQGGGPAWVEPPPYYQPMPVSPYVGGIWIEGSWTDVHGRREWRPGHWSPPHSGDVRGQPPHRGDGRYAGGQGHRPPRADIGDRGDGRRGGGSGFAGRGERPATRPALEYPGAPADRYDPRITPP